MRLRSWLTSLLAALPFLLTGCENGANSDVLARVLETTGEAFLVVPSQSLLTRTPLEAGMLVSEGQTIETGEKASATISLVPGTIVQVNANAAVGINKLILAKGGRATGFLMESRQARIELAQGSLYAVTMETYVPTELQIITPLGEIIAPQKAAFYVRATADTLRLTILDGQLSFRRKSASEIETLDSGQVGEWVAANGTITSKFRTVEAEAEGSHEAEETRYIADKMPELLTRMTTTWLGAEGREP